MKKKSLQIMIIGMLAGLAGCGMVSGDDRTTGEKTQSEARETEEAAESWDIQTEKEKQLLIMAEKKEMWLEEPEFADEVYRYAVTDLDHNGRYEVIVAHMGGTGLYTYSRFFEVNEKYDGLEECRTEFLEGDSQPDIISEKLVAYIDENGKFHYAVYDSVKNGAAEYYENVRELMLQDGEIKTNYIVSKSVTYNGEIPDVTCSDSEGNAITEAEYESGAERYFQGFQRNVISFGWQDVKELEDDAEGIARQLCVSLDIFLQNE